jgi:DNA-binding PadR family transcriptional regulator
MHGHGGPRGRARRGEARYILLEALRGGPKHGYEIMKSLEERSGGQYAPSPGTVYPTMQLLEDLGLVRADKDSERRVFHLTEAGLADLDSHAQEIADFWERFGAAPPSSQPEAGFVREELQSLERTVWEGLRGPLSAGNMDTVRAVRTALERCRNEIREILSQ